MTRLERARQDAADRELAWDEVRERRVLARIKQAREHEQRRASSRWAWLTPPRLGLGVALAGVAALLALVFSLANDDEPIAAAPELEPPPAETDVAEPTRGEAVHFAEQATSSNDAVCPGGPGCGDAKHGAGAEVRDAASRMRLPDGSLALLGLGAHVELVTFDSDPVNRPGQRVALEQTAGEVRYEVTEGVVGDFVVRSKGVEIRVIGTVFTVVAGDARVFVEVERGRVEVIAGERRSQLGPGDGLSVGLDALARERSGGSDRVREDPSQRDRPSVDELLGRIDAARGAGDDAEAAKLLGSLLRDHSGDPRATTAAFTLGRVERSRGRHRAAAEAFADYLKRAPQGVLAEDATAEQARSWADAGELEQARAIARRSLELWPRGTHAARMRELADE
jgi:transmembrane sensor